MREERQEDTGGTQSEIDQVMVKIKQKKNDRQFCDPDSDCL